VFMSAVVLSCLAAAGLMTLASADRHEAAVIELAAIAAPPEPAKDATAMDREVHVLKLGDNGTARGPIRPHSQENPPMCHEGVRMEWADAYLDEKGYADGMSRVCYMLAGDEGANNMDPYSEGQTDDSQWVTGHAHETSSQWALLGLQRADEWRAQLAQEAP
jgi:hypothetical protein